MRQSKVACQRTTPQTSSWQRPRSAGERRAVARAVSSRFSVNSPLVRRWDRTRAAICLGFWSCKEFNNGNWLSVREYKNLYMREEFEKLAAAGKIEGKHVDALTQLVEGGGSFH